MLRLVVIAAVLVACGSATRAPVTPELAKAPALQPLAWMLGDWTDLHWRAAGGALYGVGLVDGGYTITIIDDVEGKLVAFTSVNGAPLVENDAAAGINTLAWFDKRVQATSSIKLNNGALRVHVEVMRVMDTKVYAKSADETAPELEAADRAFSADTGARGIEGWMAAFEPTGVMLRKGEPISGEAIREVMSPVLAGGTLAWTPIASGVKDGLGFTVGTALFTATDPKDSWRSSYVTIWAKQPDGTWKVRFDTGRPITD